MVVKYRVRFDPRCEWYVIEKKYWFFKWEYVDYKYDKEKAIDAAKGLENPKIVWESEK
jgi:hypothetical protein